MAKSRKVNYFTKIASDEDFEELLNKKGLIILDVYQEGFGPCTMSLHGPLEKAKISQQDSDTILLAVCDVDKIEKLKRFRGRCIPTIIFCGLGKVIDIVYGANVPLLLNTVSTQLKLLQKANDGEDTRKFYEFDEPVDWEKADLDRIKAEKDEADRILKERTDLEEKKEMDELFDLMSEFAGDMGVTIFMPHVVDVAVRKTTNNARRLYLVSRARKVLQVTSDMFTALEKQLEKPINEDIKEYLIGKEVLAVLWSADPGANVEKTLEDFVRQVSETTKAIDDSSESNEEIEMRILDELVVYLDECDEDEENDAMSESLNFSLTENVEEEKSLKIEESGSVVSKIDERPKIVIPPVWTPDNKPCNCLIMFKIFRNQFEHFLPPLIEPEPPHFCMIFPASRKNEIFRITKEFEKELLAFGFFDSSDLNNCKLICKTPEKYEKVETKDSDSIILKVAKRTSHFSLALVPLNPIYVSHNVEKGIKECAMIFDESFNEANDDEEETPPE